MAIPYAQALANLQAGGLTGSALATATADLQHAYATNPGLGGTPLSGTGTPTPNPAPTLPGGTPTLQTPGLPSGDSKPGSLVSFADALHAAVDLAHTRRNAAGADIAAPYMGTVGSNSLAEIVGALNKSSDTRNTALQKSLVPDIITATSDDGTVHGIDKATGKVVWSAPGVGNKQGGSGTADTLIHSGNLVYTRTDYSDDASTLEQSRGTDGYVDPNTYKQLYDAWVSHGGKISDFVTQFPPDKYVNPANSFLPTYLRPKVSGVTNPFAK